MGWEDEHLKVLDLLEKGNITSTQAAELITVLSSPPDFEKVQPADTARQVSAEKPRRAQWMRIRITELSTGKRKINLLLPIFFLKFGISFSEKRAITAEERDRLLMGKMFFKEAIIGKIVDTSDPDEDQRVEIAFL